MITATETDRDTLTRLRVTPSQLADDGRDYAGQTVVKPWGHEKELYKTADSCAWRLTLTPLAETSMHCHTGKTVVFFVERGAILLDTLGETIGMSHGDSLVVGPGVFHRVRTIDGARLIEVESPPNRNDIVRISDKYGRAGKPYSYGSIVQARMERAA